MNDKQLKRSRELDPSEPRRRGRPRLHPPAEPKQGDTLPTRFVPKFWADADRRVSTVRRVEALVQRLKADGGCDSVQREILAERAAFIAVLLQTSELNAIEEGQFEPGPYTQGVNALVGCLRALGLERRVATIGLKSYLKGLRGNAG